MLEAETNVLFDIYEFFKCGVIQVKCVTFKTIYSFNSVRNVVCVRIHDRITYIYHLYNGKCILNLDCLVDMSINLRLIYGYYDSFIIRLTYKPQVRKYTL